MLKNKTVFISGGSGYLGRAICEKCLAYQARVIFSYHKHERQAHNLNTELPDLHAVQIDLKDINDIKSKITALYKKYESIDVLINNAGVSQVMPLSLLEEDDFDEMIDVNIKGSFYCVKESIPYLKKTSGHIILISATLLFQLDLPGSS